MDNSSHSSGSTDQPVTSLASNVQSGFYADIVSSSVAVGKAADPKAVADEHADHVSVAAHDQMGSKPEPNATWYSAAAHVICAMVGTGILALPKAMAQLTWIPGILLMAAAFCITYFSTYLLSRATEGPEGTDPKTQRPSTYIQMCTMWIGKRRTAFYVMPFLYIAVVGTCIAYLIVAGENISNIYNQECEGCAPVRQMVWTSAISGLQLVLCLLPSLEKLVGVSVIASIASFGYAAIVVVLCSVMAGRIALEPQYTLTGSVLDGIFGVFTALTTLAFAFNMSQVQIEIEATLAYAPPKVTPHRSMMKAVRAAYAFVLIAYFGAAVAGYYTFGEAVQGNVLLSMSQYATTGVEKGFVIAAQIMVVVHVTMAYQIFGMVIYVAMERAYVRWRHQPCPRLLSWVMRWSYVIFTWFVSILIPFFTDIMSLMGAIAYVPLCFIIPCAFYLMRLRSAPQPANRLMVALLYFIIVAMTIIGLLGAAGAIRQIVLDASTFQLFK